MSAQDEWKTQDAFREKGKVIRALRDELADKDKLLDTILATLDDESVPAVTRVVSVAELVRAHAPEKGESDAE